MSITAMKSALEALEWNLGGEPLPTKELEAVTALRQAIEQAEKQKPVAYRKEAHGMWFYIENKPSPPNDDYEPLYTAPPKPQNELDAIDRAYFAGKEAGIAECEAIAKLQEKNT
jgi:hypothetical protein